MSIYQIDPIGDPRWAEFVERHPRASVFAAPGWLEALRRSYGYEPFVLTTSPPRAELRNGLPVCRVKSWLAGSRLVSLPFSDHCEPLVDRPEDLDEMLAFLTQEARQGKWKYAELRPCNAGLGAEGSLGGFQVSETHYFHKLDLSPSLEELFRRLHKTSMRQMIQRAEREGLAYEEGRAESHLSRFYQLQVLTRRRHGLPPQPLAWFRNLVDCLGDKLSLRVASKDGHAVASVLTVSDGSSIVYKYGCSDPRYHVLGGMPFLFWRTIQEAKKQGLREFDLGRSETENSGLVTFKDRLGASRSTLTYYRYPASTIGSATNGWKLQVAKRVFSHMPDRVLTAAGSLLYKHLA
jgi:CelD/BcsL family acetyltransferase involved in cellulose biosynthesis